MKGMKRCGQWLFVLLIAAALLYPQAATAVSRLSIEAPRLIESQVQSLPLIADFAFKKTVNAEAECSATPDSPEQTQGDGAPRVFMPSIAARTTHDATPVEPVIEAVRGRLPFVCGPPAQN